MLLYTVGLDDALYFHIRVRFPTISALPRTRHGEDLMHTTSKMYATGKTWAQN